MQPPTLSGPPRRDGRRRQRGFTVIEMTIALFITAEVVLAALALFDFHNKLARVQTQISDMQQTLRVAQYEMVRLTRMAGRGGLPAITNGAWSAISVRNNVVAGSDAVAVGFAGSPTAVDGTDIFKLRGVFASPVYQVNATNINAATTKVAVCAYTEYEVPQNLQPLISAVQSAATLNQTEGLLVVSPLSDSVYSVIELDPTNSVLTGAPAGSCQVPAWVATAPNPTGITIAFKTAPDSLTPSFQAISTGTMGVTPMTSIAWLGILEEYRYYVRSDFVIPGNAASDPAPHLSRARMIPGTELPYQNNSANLQVDVADNVMDLQISLGVDLNGDGIITEANPPNSTDEWLGNATGDNLTPQTPLREVRITTLAKTGNRDFQYTGPLLTTIEDHTYKPTDFPNTPAGRAYRHRLLQSVVGLRNL
jgi:Tfp pilus assembly protein FimT